MKNLYLKKYFIYEDKVLTGEDVEESGDENIAKGIILIPKNK